MYDALIVGGGPAGLAAAVYFARQKLSFALIAPSLGGNALWSSDVENYLGFHVLDGIELVKRFREHLADYKDAFDLKEGESVERIDKQAKGFLVKTAKAVYQTRTVLIATGTSHRKLHVPGEDEFMNKGVTYCANCDAPLYKDKNVFVIGGGNSATSAALLSAKYAKHVTLVTINPTLTGDESIKKQIAADKGITVLTNTKTTRIVGTKFVEHIGLQTGTDPERLEPTEGVFIEIGLEPISQFIDFVAKDKGGQIIVDKQNSTSVEGIWAAGDVTDIAQKQIAVAVGEGSKAALAIIKFLQQH